MKHELTERTEARDVIADKIYDGALRLIGVQRFTHPEVAAKLAHDLYIEAAQMAYNILPYAGGD